METFVHRDRHVGALQETVVGIVYRTYDLEKHIGVVIISNFVVIKSNH